MLREEAKNGRHSSFLHGQATYYLQLGDRVAVAGIK